MSRFFTGLLIFLVVFSRGICIADEKELVRNSSVSVLKEVPVKRFEKKFGPFEVSKKQFHVVADITQREGQAPVYHGFEIRDEGEVVHYKQSLEAMDLEAVFTLEGKSGDGLILYFNTAMKPPAGKALRIFGLENGKMIPLGAPLNIYGQMVPLARGRKPRSFALFDGDVIKVEVWKDFMGIIVPLVVDLGKLTMSPSKSESGLDIIAAPGPPYGSIAKPVMLYKDHNKEGGFEKLTSGGAVKITLVDAHGRVSLKGQNPGRMLDIAISDLWLRVRINDKEGWVDDIEGFFKNSLRSPQSLFNNTGVIRF